MKLIATTLFLTVLALAGCGERAAPRGPEPPVVQDIEKLRRDFQHASQRRIDDVGVQIEKLRAKAKAAEGDARVRLEKLGDDLAQRRDAVAADLRSFGDKAADKWDDFKLKFTRTLDDLERAVRDALA